MNVVGLIITIILIILILFLILKVMRGKVYSGDPQPSTITQVVTSSELGSYDYGSTNEYTYSIWVYVNNWNVNYGLKKIIFERGQGSDDGTKVTGDVEFQLYLDEYGNNLVAETTNIKANSKFYYFPDKKIQTGTGVAELKTETYTRTGSNSIKANCDASCNVNSSCLGYNFAPGTGGTGSCTFYGNTPLTDANILSAMNGLTSAGTTGYSAIKDNITHTCVVPAIDTQQWVNIVVSSSGFSLDMYINGKLVKTCVTSNTLTSAPSGNVYICPNKVGFDGWNAQFKSYTYYMNPSQVWNIYRSGYSSFIGNLNLDYSLTLGVYKGNVEKASVTI